MTGLQNSPLTLLLRYMAYVGVLKISTLFSVPSAHEPRPADPAVQAP